MIRNQFVIAAALLAAGGAAACASDAPTAPASPAPAAAPHLAVTTRTPVVVNAVRWTSGVSPLVVSRVIGPAGGTLSIANGIKLTVPARAVSSNVTFSIKRMPGIVVAYDFQPHGTRFAVPVTIEHPLAGTNAKQLPWDAGIQGAYFPTDASLNQSAGTANVTEFRPTLVAVDKNSVKFTADHFSGYVVGWSRTRR